MLQPTRLYTAEELERRPDLEKYELWEGRLVPMTPVGFRHSQVGVRLASLLDRHARDNDLGTVLAQLGVKLRSEPDTVFAPDIAFIRRDRIPDATPRGFWRGAADLAIEVLSPEDRKGKIRRKIDEYLVQGTRLVVVVDPEKESVSLFRSDSSPVILSGDDTLDLNDVLPGFTCPVRAIFE
jgi:Uma2 family endonuclease